MNDEHEEIDWIAELPDSRKPGRNDLGYLILEGFIEFRVKPINEYGTLTYDVFKHPSVEHISVITFTKNTLNEWGGVETSDDDGPPTNGYLLDPKTKNSIMITQALLQKVGVRED